MNGKKLRLITEILAILVICLVSFVGVYTQKANQMENKVKQYSLSKDLNGYRELIFSVSDATEVTDENGKVVGNTDEYTDTTIESYSYTKTDKKVNEDENLTEENYKKTKKIIEERLEKLGVSDYDLSQDLTNGLIYVQIPENEDTDHTVSNILQKAEFKIADSEDNTKVFLTNSDIKNVAAVYNTTETGTIVYLQIEFNEAGRKQLKELSIGEYATKEEESTENSENQNEIETEAEVSTEETENSEVKSENTENESEENKDNSQKQITLSIDNNSMITTSFDEPMENGAINLSMNSATKDEDKINETLRSTSTIALLLNSDSLPLTYKVEANRYIGTDIQNKTIKNIVYVGIAIIAIAIVFLVLKYKGRGILAGIAYIGFLALYLIVIRYTNVLVGIESAISLAIVLILNYIITLNILKIDSKEPETRKNSLKEEIKNTIIKLMPIFFIAIVFTFTKWTAITIFGMFIVWGIILMIIYNFLLTQDMID